MLPWDQLFNPKKSILANPHENFNMDNHKRLIIDTCSLRRKLNLKVFHKCIMSELKWANVGEVSGIVYSRFFRVIAKFTNLGSQTNWVLLTINKRQAKSRLLSKYSQAKPQQVDSTTPLAHQSKPWPSLNALLKGKI